MTDLAETFAEFAASTRAEQLPSGVAEATRRGILDVLGTILAASGAAPGSAELLALVQDWGGCPQSTAIPSGLRTSSLLAAFHNGALGHALDYDDTLDDCGIHPSVLTVPATLALAEAVGGISGRDWIVAVAVGNEIACRLGRAVARAAPPGRPIWMPSTVFGPLAAAAACGRLLGLDADRIRHAFGIALHQAGGTQELAYSTGSIIRGFYGAFPASSGLTAALMARRGISGSEAAFDGEAGLFAAFFGSVYDRDLVLGGLGSTYHCAEVSIKPWPSCRASQIFMTAALDLLREHDIAAADIARLEVLGGELAMKLCSPIEQRRRPRTSLDAKFSIPYSLALVVARGTAQVRDFMPEHLGDPDVLAVADRVEARFDARFNNRGAAAAAGALILETRDGRRHERYVEHAYGHPERPLGDAALHAKLADCLSYARPALPDGRAEALVDMVGDLDKCPDVRALVPLLCAPAPA